MCFDQVKTKTMYASMYYNTGECHRSFRLDSGDCLTLVFLDASFHSRSGSVTWPKVNFLNSINDM